MKEEIVEIINKGIENEEIDIVLRRIGKVDIDMMKE